MAHIPKYPDEAAFPQPRQESLPSDVAALTLLPAQWGLTKRELFAAMAMQGMLSNAGYVAAASRVAVEDGITGVESISRAARQHADGLLTELAK